MLVFENLMLFILNKKKTIDIVIINSPTPKKLLNLKSVVAKLNIAPRTEVLSIIVVDIFFSLKNLKIKISYHY
jgi:tmRNA-binding protein